MMRRPVSPRLVPIGSPGGPVTPIDLGEAGGGYLTNGKAVSHPLA